MDAGVAKICSIVVLGVSTLVAGFLPAWFSAHGRQQKPLLISSLLCFGGGVLLATSFIHMLPEFRESFHKYKEYTEVIFSAGFFLIFLIDEVIHYFFGGSHDPSTHEENHPSNRVVDNRGNQPLNGSNTRQDPHYGTIEVDPLLYGQRQPPYNPNHVDTAWDETPSQLCHVTHKEPCAVSPVGNLSLLVALTVHALLEGLPIGLQNSTSKVFLLLGAIASHKLIVSFCLGVELASSPGNTKCRHFMYIFIFSAGTVLGIFCGMIITKIPKGVSDILFPVLKGVTGGTLLYVTVSEILPRERARWHKQHSKRYAGIIQFLSVSVGFALMAVLTKYLGN